MKGLYPIIVSALMVTACSETPIDDQTPEETAVVEKEIEDEARSLEEAADEAARVLENEISIELPPEPADSLPAQAGNETAEE